MPSGQAQKILLPIFRCTSCPTVYCAPIRLAFLSCMPLVSQGDDLFNGGLSPDHSVSDAVHPLDVRGNGYVRIDELLEGGQLATVQSKAYGPYFDQAVHNGEQPRRFGIEGNACRIHEASTVLDHGTSPRATVWPWLLSARRHAVGPNEQGQRTREARGLGRMSVDDQRTRHQRLDR
jgi:hypothetical protein